MSAERAACKPYEKNHERQGTVNTPQVLIYLDSGYSDSNVGGLNHAHIVRAIADGEKYSFLVLLDELDDKSLLQW